MMEEPLEAAGPDEDAPSPSGQPLPARPGALRQLLAAVLDALKTRLDLAAVETELYFACLVQALLWGFATLLCAAIGLFFAMATVIAALWNTHPYAGLLGSMFVFFVLAAVCATVGARSLRARPQLLSGTLEQFERDQRRMSASEGGR